MPADFTHPFLRIVLFAFLAMGMMTPLLPAHAEDSDNLLIDPWSVPWKYLDDGSDQGTAWKQPEFDDSSWASGLAQFGYGYGSETTLINRGPVGANFITSYYRRTFTVTNPSIYVGLRFYSFRDDGIIVYINGSEVFRNNMPDGAISNSTLASSEINADDAYDALVISSIVGTALLQTGDNTIAVEIHQSSATSPDSSFSLALLGDLPPPSPGVFERGPYLQMITPTSAIIRWGTTIASNSVVRFGNSPDTLTQSVTDVTATYHHEVQLNGLTPATTYYYSIGSSTSVIKSGADYFFKTQPPSGTHTPTRLWVIGDSGRAGQADEPALADNQRAVYQGYRNFTGNTYTDLWLLLGDNAYLDGTDQQYQDGFFNIYTSLLRQTVVWPSLGNHDGHSVHTPSQTGIYYGIFTLPKAGEAGGIASGTEAYYSYNYGNIHFVVLDAYDVDRAPTGAMAQWLESDLIANTADWIIAYWHHPPYTKGSHDSDTEIELIEMRENILPILEQHGVDLVLAGHSHSYERSKFVQGHYGYSNTYSDASFAIDTSSGNPLKGVSAYSKAHPAVSHGGTVYAVVGVAAEAAGGNIDHPVMYQSFHKLGSMVIDVNNLALSARFIDENGLVQDAFTVQKLATGIDSDGDGFGNSNDNCPNNANSGQRDTDQDSQGDICDSDNDNDGIADATDNCPVTANSNQLDTDINGQGNACGNDRDGDGVPDYIDANSFDIFISYERQLSVNSLFKGTNLRENIKPL